MVPYQQYSVRVRDQFIDLMANRWWCYLERKRIEGIVFKAIEQETVEALHTEPWIPPASIGHVVNAEHLKCNASKH